MGWIDDGRGGWTFNSQKGVGATVKPTTPPPSAVAAAPGAPGGGEIGGVRIGSGPSGGTSSVVDMGAEMLRNPAAGTVRPLGATPGNRGGTLVGDLNIGTQDLMSDLAGRQASAAANRAAVPAPTSVLTPNAGTSAATPGPTLSGAPVAGRTAIPAGQLPPRAATAPAIKPPAGPTGNALQFDQGSAAGTTPDNVNSAAEQGAQNSRDALGPAPTIDQDLADRGYEQFQASLGMSREVLDQLMNPANDGGLSQATTDARAVLDQLLNGPNNADRIGAQTLREQMAMTRSAAGGPGAVQEAFRNAQAAAPELQAQATQSAVTEDLSRMNAAGGVAQGLGNLATSAQANETQRLQAAGNVASGFSQAALGGRQQDIGIAASNQQAATSLMQNVAQLTGTQLELDQRSQELVGQMARDAAALDFNWAQLTAQQQNANFDRWVQVYQIDEQVAAQIKAAATAAKKGPWDYIVPIIGALATVGASAIPKPK